MMSLNKAVDTLGKWRDSLSDWWEKYGGYFVTACIWAVLVWWWIGKTWFDILMYVFVILVGFWATGKVLRDLYHAWSLRLLSPDISGRSLVFPRVWTFQINWSQPWMKEALASRGLGSDELALGFRSDWVNPEFLRELKIEEYATRVRFHCWFVSSDITDETPRYEWRDDRTDSYPTISYFYLRKGLLWSHGTGEIPAKVNLSATSQYDSKRDRYFLQLTLWIEHPRHAASTADHPLTPIPQSDIIFTVPLDPGTLDNERDRALRVKGKWYRASEVVPYPHDEESWEYHSGEGKEWKWSWWLKMQTFHER